jgi:diaminohydroxyphosphoribosylaminopyrimidine deaminase / 5-amino-6-(5-phosphoribosylamino)uracil reductase
MAEAVLTDEAGFMRLALRLARKGYGRTSPNPMVGAVLVKQGRIIGRGWHHRAGAPHAEIEALLDAASQGLDPAGATLYVTLEPCCTFGRTPPCTEAIIQARLRRVVVAATDPNPKHAGRGFRLLNKAGLEVEHGLLGEQARRLNEAFNHWIAHGTPWVTLKSAMTLDGKIATATGESKWITSDVARRYAMTLRQGTDAILVGVNTILADDPSLTRRSPAGNRQAGPNLAVPRRRIVLDSRGRTPLEAKIVTDNFAHWTTIVVTRAALARRVAALARKVTVWTAPSASGRVDLRWLLRRLGQDQVTSVLVESGGQVNGSFIDQRLAHRIAFFYAPKILGGKTACPSVGGRGASKLAEALKLVDLEWRRLGDDLLLTARLD